MRQARPLRPVWSPSVRRRTFAAQLFGLSADRSVSVLKRYLYQADLTPASDQKLDLVMVEDYAHLTELVSEAGLPMIRIENPTLLPTITYVQVQRRWLYAFLTTLPLVVLFGGEGQLWDLFPWK